jgi:hypothetical protein
MTAMLVSMAECDGALDCYADELYDSHCSTDIDYIEYGYQYISYMGYIVHYTSQPPIGFIASSCGNSTADFFDSNWLRIHTTAFSMQDDECHMVNSTVANNAVFVLKLRDLGSSQSVTIIRKQPTDVIFFSRHVSMVDYADDVVTIRVELTATYDSYPYCCPFPESFVSDDYTFLRTVDEEHTCGVSDIVTYELQSSNPSSITTLNTTHERWIFEFDEPTNESCGSLINSNALTDAFTVSLDVPSVPHVRLLTETAPSPISTTMIFFATLIPMITMFLISYKLRKNLRR